MELELIEGGKILIKDIETAEAIRPITKEEAFADYDKLVEIHPKANDLTKLIGNRFVDYYMFPYRLNTACNRYGSVNFFEFNEKPSSYLGEKKLVAFNQFVKEQMSKGHSKDKATYLFFGHWVCSVSIFKPIIAKYLYEMYNPHTILDITMGWGGRLAGAMSIPNTNYIGFDTNTDLKEPYDEMVKDLKCSKRVKLYFKDSAKADLSKFKYDMVFTSPPYFLKGSDKSIEGYANMPSYESYDDWTERFFNPVMTNAYNNMEKGGAFCINTNATDYELLKKLFGIPNKKINIRNKASHRDPKEKADKDKKVVKSTEYIYIWIKS